MRAPISLKNGKGLDTPGTLVSNGFSCIELEGEMSRQSWQAAWKGTPAARG